MTFRVQFAAVTGLLAVGLAAVPAANAASATGRVYGADAPGAISGSYLVLTEEKAAGAAQDAVRSAGGRLGHQFRHALNGFEAGLTVSQAARIAGLPGVTRVEQNRVMRSAQTQPTPPSWGLDRIDQRTLPLDNSFTASTGETVTAYVIDSGVRISHEEFEARASHGVDTIDNDDVADDCFGHGTHVAGTVGGIVSGVAKSVGIVAVRVLDCSGSGTIESVVAGIDWVTANAVRPAVATLSLGGDPSDLLDGAVRRSIESGVTYAVAANNQNKDACLTSPARTEEAITVGASTRDDERAAFSNFGTCVDLFAPGDQIVSAGIASDSAARTASGTSMAAPHVAGAAALLLAEDPGLTPAGVRAALIAAATPSLLTNPGTGSPNLLLHLG